VRRLAPVVAALVAAVALAQTASPPLGAAPPSPDGSMTIVAEVRASIQRHLGRPYVWGATGRKSFDCSGFVWRVMLESGVLVKRTTARKYYVSLKTTDKGGTWSFPTLVFFDDLQHMGIVNDRDTFYHAQCSKGTNLSGFDPFWRGKICGFRAMPLQPASAGASPDQPTDGEGETPPPPAAPGRS
jgi:cell wall-associated NlpC family hydrolase